MSETKKIALLDPDARKIELSECLQTAALLNVRFL